MRRSVQHVPNDRPGEDYWYKYQRISDFQAPMERDPLDCAAGERHWNKGGTWESPFRFADDFHVFGLEWTPEQLIQYVRALVFALLLG